MIRLNKRPKNKYGAKKTTVGGNTFDSKMESQYHQVLLNMQRAGLITDLRLQPKYLLLETYTKLGKKHQAIHYVGDFEYRDEGGHLVVVDVKGAETKDFKLKRKMFDQRYPDIELKVVTEYHGRWMPIEERDRLESERKKAEEKLKARITKQNEGR